MANPTHLFNLRCGETGKRKFRSYKYLWNTLALAGRRNYAKLLKLLSWQQNSRFYFRDSALDSLSTRSGRQSRWYFWLLTPRKTAPDPARCRESRRRPPRYLDQLRPNGIALASMRRTRRRSGNFDSLNAMIWSAIVPLLSVPVESAIIMMMKP